MLYEGKEVAMSGAAGIPALLELFVESQFFSSLLQCLPVRLSNSSYDTQLYGLLFIAGFLRGYECIENWAEFENDPAILYSLQELPCTQSLRDFLQDFQRTHVNEFNGFLTDQSLRSRRALGKTESITLDIDATSHLQSGRKIEGVSYNYKNEWCLDSLQILDELGFCYSLELREGSTFSSVGACELLTPVLAQVREKNYKRIYIRGDSAYCCEEMIRLGLTRDKKGRRIHFTLTAHDRIGWRETIINGGIQNWKPWVYSEKEIKFAEKHKKVLPTIELGHFYYEPGFGEGKIKLPLIVKRTWTQDKDTKQWRWEYYGVLCNWDLFFHSYQEIMEFHFGRCTSENIFKEQKHSYDLKHFKCRKLLANHGYGLLAMATHNYMRLIAHLESPQRPHFIKALRRKFILFPGKLLGKTQNWRLQIPEYYAKEVEKLRHAWERAVLFSLGTSYG